MMIIVIIIIAIIIIIIIVTILICAAFKGAAIIRGRRLFEARHLLEEIGYLFLQSLVDIMFFILKKWKLLRALIKVELIIFLWNFTFMGIAKENTPKQYTIYKKVRKLAWDEAPKMFLFFALKNELSSKIMRPDQMYYLPENNGYFDQLYPCDQLDIN